MIHRMLHLLDELAAELQLPVDETDRYRSILHGLRAVSGQYSLPPELRSGLLAYLRDVAMGREDEVLDRYGARSLAELSDADLLQVLLQLAKTVSFTQSGDLLLLKYNNNIWETGWNRFSRLCRGKVIHIKTGQVVSYPFDKFFNLNETGETRLERVRSLLEHARCVNVTEKKDGSTIIVTNHGGHVLMHTNGSFTSAQIPMAEEIFARRYPDFLPNVPQGMTFVFELIHPENRIVVNYGDEQCLYLLAVRDLTTGRLVSREELCKIAARYALDPVPAVAYSDLDSFMDEACRATGIEGWVFRVITEEEDFLFKLKCSEYFQLARLKNLLSRKNIYTWMAGGQLDDALSTANQDLQREILDTVQSIQDELEDIQREIQVLGDRICDWLGGTPGEIPNSTMAEYAGAARGSPLFSHLMRYFRTGIVEDLLERMPSWEWLEKWEQRGEER